MAKLSLDDRLNQIEDKISEKSFRENKGLGNEVGYYIFDYDPREELYVRNHIAYLKDRINNGNKDFRIVEFDLFHLMVEILQEEGYLEAFFDLEKENGFFEMADSLVETLGLDETNELNLIISRILQEDLTDSVVFLTGVGKCHPIIASHNILNNLHQVLDSVPVVLFYPGEYSGQDLKLFGTMCLWNGLMKIVQETSLMKKLTKIISPLMKILFPKMKKEDKEYKEITINIIANLLGIGNAATPLGLKAMQTMQEKNPQKDRITDSMAMFIVLNTASIQLIPSTVIAVRASLGSVNPSQIIVPVWIATIAADVAGIIASKMLMKKF